MYSLGNKAVPLFISWGVMLTKGATSSAVRGRRHSPFYKQHSLILVPKMTIPANRINYKRKHKRFPTQREAQYCFDGNTWDGQVCTIVNVSRRGMGIIFHTDEEMRVGAIIRVEVPCTQSSESISVRGTMKWVDRMEFDIIGGIELINELSDLQLSRLEPFKSVK